MFILDLGLLCLELNHSFYTEALDKITSYLDFTLFLSDSSPSTISHGNQNMSSKRDISNVCGEIVEHENKMNSIKWN